MSSPSDVLENVAPPTPQVFPPAEDKRVWAERVVSDILRLMGLPAKLDLKDAEDGSLSIAVMFEAELPGIVAGKRSQMMDSLQFLVNKIVNRPGGERRWVNLGAFGHPPPRGVKKAAPVAALAAPASPPAPAAKLASKPSSGKPEPKNGHAKNGATKPAAAIAPSPDEMSVDVKADKALTAATKALMEKSAKHGRFFGVFGMDLEDRSRFLQAVAKAKGATAKAEGEGRMRRLVVTPAEPKPMPKFVLPDWDEEEELDEE